MSSKLRYTMVVRNPDTLEATALLAGEPMPDWAADLVHEDDIEGADADTGYQSMKVDELKAEIASRNEGRDDDAKIPATGNKAELVAALEADDNA